MTKRLTNADIAEIKKRVDKVAKGNLLVSLSALQTNNKVIFEDVPALLAEVERLQAELTQVKKERDKYSQAYSDASWRLYPEGGY